MAENGFELRNVAWKQAFPFLRLFGTFRLSVGPARLALALLAITSIYFTGRVLDGIWKSAGGGVLVVPERNLTEIDAYARTDAAEFASGRTAAEKQREEKIVSAAIALGNAENRGEARKKLDEGKADELLATHQLGKDVEEALAFIDEQLKSARARINGNEEWSSDVKAGQLRAAEEAADNLRCVLDRCAARAPQSQGSSGTRMSGSGELLNPRSDLMKLMRAAGDEQSETQRSVQETTSKTLAASAALEAVERCEPRGPFISLLHYESRCFAGAIRGVCTFNWGFDGGPDDDEPAFAGSVGAAFSGIGWLVTQRPCFTVFFGLLHFAIFAFFGGALCRHAAVQMTRDEAVSLGDSLRFAREKFTDLVLAPLTPIGVFVAIGFLIWFGGFIGAIPFIGELLTSILYFLALLGGLAMAIVLIALVLGLHLMIPTIAVESSDLLDAVQHAVNYITQRVWHFAFYTVVTLLYGALCFVMIRLIAMLSLKFAHLCTNAGMSMFGSWSGSGIDTVTKFNAMWQMPHWGELSLLPTTAGMPFWGTFHNAPLSGSEWLAMFFLQCWVFLVVGLVGAFVVSFFFCGSTHMYFLLRHDVDAVEYEEIFVEETEDDYLPQADAGSAMAGAGGSGSTPAGSDAPSDAS